MSKNTNISYAENNLMVFWSFMKEKYPVYRNSNVFFRDIQFGLKDFFAKTDRVLDYSESEKVAQFIVKTLEQKGILKQLNSNTWKVDILEDNVLSNSNL